MTVSAPLWLLLLPLLTVGAVVLWGLTPSAAGQERGALARHRLALGVRLLLATLLVGALAGVAWDQDVRRQAVVFVADLSASDAAVRDRAEAWISAALRAQGPDDLAGLVAVGRTALVEQPMSRRGITFDHFQSVVDANYTNLAGGLDLAAALLPSDARRRVVLLTDGQQNLGDATQEARLLRAEGIRLDVAPLAVPAGPEMLVDAVEAPSTLHTGESFAATVRTRSTAGGRARLDLYIDDRLAGAQDVALSVGADTFSFPLSAPAPGFHTFRAVLLPDGGSDTLAANNEGSAFAEVQGPPRLLVIENAPGAARNVVAALRSRGLRVDEQPALRVTPTLASLQRYAGLVVVDTPADLLGADLLNLLPRYVRDLGHGVAVIGGPASYALGGYGQTPLEEILPVRMDIPQRKDTPTAAVVLIVENLESDYNVNISKVAAKGVVKLLTPQDRVAVNDTNAGWAVPLQRVTDKGAINRAIDAMQPNDPPSYAASLNLAARALRTVTAPIKHIILLGDGDAYDYYGPLVRGIVAQGISISTVATGASTWQDFATMQDIARWGHGHYYRADAVESIPQIFLKEAKRVARTAVVDDHFVPSAVSFSALLRGLDTLPQLDGYVATTSKAAGENVLISARADPILASWQYGLGRTVAWTSDSAGLWTQHLLAWPDAARLWSNIASWIVPPPATPDLTLTASAQGGVGHLAADVSGLAAARVSAHVVGPDLAAATVTLLPTAPGHYEADIAAAQQGAYLVHVVASNGTKTLTASGGLVAPYSPEFRLTGVDWATVDALAAENGGAVLATAPREAARAFADDLPPVTASRPLSELLLLLAALLLPLDIALRRLALSPRELVALMLGRVRRERSVAPVPMTASTPLLRLRNRRAARLGPSAGEPRQRTTGDAPGMGPPARQAPPLPDPASPEGAPSPAMSSQLLEAKRRRQRR